MHKLDTLKGSPSLIQNSFGLCGVEKQNLQCVVVKQMMMKSLMHP